MKSSLYHIPPDAVLILIEAGMLALDMDNKLKDENPLAGMTEANKRLLAASIVEANKYVLSVRDALADAKGPKISEELIIVK